jgi:hypothetical protein
MPFRGLKFSEVKLAMAVKSLEPSGRYTNICHQFRN